MLLCEECGFVAHAGVAAESDQSGTLRSGLQYSPVLQRTGAAISSTEISTKTPAMATVLPSSSPAFIRPAYDWFSLKIPGLSGWMSGVIAPH